MKLPNATKVKEQERGVLTVAVPDVGLAAGDVGTVVHVYADKRAYEVEFLTLVGRTAAVVTLEASQVRPVGRREITHARELAEARRRGRRRVVVRLLGSQPDCPGIQSVHGERPPILVPL